MAINADLLRGLSDGELRTDRDFPHTSRIFEHLGRAGISSDRVSKRTLLEVAVVAVHEDAEVRALPDEEALSLYRHVHDVILEAPSHIDADEVAKPVVESAA
ncbi:MAG TPA: hypothetical protein VLE69_00255 [Candidatus Saccharimonadales bacterium]|nr:hypothetical protein [Candidatus Saccharimonadales bacterium]